jgi:hypothetical protein
VDKDQDQRLSVLEDVLDRRRPIEALAALRRAHANVVVDPATYAQKTIAVGIDTNALYRLADKRRADVVDYLATRHAGPIVLPGQVVQEFWNNILGGMPRASELVRSKYSALSDEVKKLSLDLTPFDERFLGLVDEFDQAYSVTLDPATGSRVTTVLDALQRTALVPYVVRSRFYLLAEARDKTRTPPGFKDPGHGDFYVWADYLLGLLTARANGVVFDHAVLVTEDVKIDWSLRGIAHPILVAEVEALTQVPFETWDVDRLAQYVLTVAGPPPEQT